ncbi:hypothetical protein FRC07_015176 [Ceratobasidium sp. 392]|nr:hypothetical protein FRC07_015176 [Ceratobasidium sp. 392]
MSPPDADAPASLDLNPDSTGSAGSISDILGLTSPVEITTTKDISSDRLLLKASGVSLHGAPLSVDDEDPAGSTEQTTRWLNSQQKTHDGVDGYLDIVGPSDDGPMTVKIANLRFPKSSTGHNPFELGPETELGSLIFLAPTEPSEVSPATLGAQVSNHTTAMFDPRSVPLSVFSAYNTTSFSTHNNTSLGSFNPTSASSTIGLVTVRLKADASVGKSDVRESLCVTYNNNYDQIQGEPPMRLQRCSDSYIPGAPSASHSSSETQLWQYDPVTREVQPLLSKVEAANESELVDEPSSVSTGIETATSSGIMVVETAPPVYTGAESTSASAVQGPTVTSAEVPPANSEVPTHSMTRRDEGDDLMKHKSKPEYSKSPKLDSAIQKQDTLAPSLVAVPLVEPYNLIFTPKSSVKNASVKAPRLPA